MPKTVDIYKKALRGGVRACNNLPQSLHLSFCGLRKIVACSHSSSQCLLVSTVFGTVSSLQPTSFLMIFTLVNYTRNNFRCKKCLRIRTSCMKIRSSYVKIMIFRPLILAVDRLY